MQIDLPDDLMRRAERLATGGEGAAAVIAKGIERLEQEAAEVAAVLAGIEDDRAGLSRPYEEFSAEILGERGLSADR